MNNRQYWILAALAIYNCVALAHVSYHVLTWPDSVTLHVTSDEVKAYRDAAGVETYRVQVPLKTFPYSVALRQHHRFDPLWLASVNVVLLAALIHSYWQTSRSRRPL